MPGESSSKGFYTQKVRSSVLSASRCDSGWRPRRLEDKLNDHKIEFRQFFMPLDISGLHHNRSMPGEFVFYLCVADMCLPSQGTAHRANRGIGKAMGSKECMKTENLPRVKTHDVKPTDGC